MSRSLNRVELIGNLGRDPEVKHTPSGTPVAKLSIATGYRVKNKTNDQWEERTEWHTVVLWQRLAEVAGEYLKKGSKVYVSGRLSTRSWEDKEKAITRYSTEVIGEDLLMLTTPPKMENAAQTGPITDEDIPF